MDNFLQNAANAVGSRSCMCHLLPTFTFHSLSGTLMHSTFLLLLCSEKIVKVGHLQAFRYSIFNCFLVDFKSLHKDGSLCYYTPCIEVDWVEVDWV